MNKNSKYELCKQINYKYGTVDNSVSIKQVYTKMIKEIAKDESLKHIDAWI